VKLYSSNGEFALLSFGSTARGVIAIGGAAYGIIAIGAVGSAGVIAVGMNAFGSVAAFGMNAVAPISFSLINGLGLYTRAGVNGYGAWATAGTNAAGVVSDGGVNNSISWIPTVIVIVALLVISSALPGKRAKRERDPTPTLREFLSSPELESAKVRARLRGVREGNVELQDGPASQEIDANAETRELAEALWTGKPRDVIAELVRVEESEPVSRELSYRERPQSTTTTVTRCVGLELAPEPEGWLPKDLDEIQWFIAWSARLSVAVAVGLLVWRAAG
jgi:hypothetical protein